MIHIRTSPAAVLSISGEDHAEFLQGQGTADLRGEPGLAAYTLWLDFKGRVLGDSFVLKVDDEHMLLVSYDTPVAQLMAKFERHIIADDVEIKDMTPLFDILSFRADEPGSPDEPPPHSGHFSRSGDRWFFHGRRLGPGTIDCLLPADSDYNPGGRCLTGKEAMEIRIRAGIPAIPADTDEGSLNPLELNILSALSFDKGCYLGQEVVARIHRLGRSTRCLAVFEGLADSIQGPAALHLDGVHVGRLTSVVKIIDNFVATGWLKRKLPEGEVALDEGLFEVRFTSPS